MSHGRSGGDRGGGGGRGGGGDDDGLNLQFGRSSFKKDTATGTYIVHLEGEDSETCVKASSSGGGGGGGG